MMAARGVYFDPVLVLHNYLDNRPKFPGIGKYTEVEFRSMERSVRPASTGSAQLRPQA
jgi:hypothetical protein